MKKIRQSFERFGDGERMEGQSLSLEDIRDCQKAILDFVPVPVTEKQRQVLENYRAGKLEEVRDDISLCGDYGKS